MGTGTILTFVILFGVRLAPARDSAMDDARQRLDRIVEEYGVSEHSFIQGLARVATDFRLPMGIELVKDPATLRPVRFAFKGKTVLTIVGCVAGAVPGYAVDVEDGLVHVHPVGSYADWGNFLNRRLDHFEMVDQFAFEGNRRLKELLEPIVATPRGGPRPGGVAGDYATGEGAWRVSFSLEKPTVRQVLDKLTSESEFKIWIVTFAPGAQVTATGFRRTVGLVSSAPVPDDEQPAWELVTWGEDPLSGKQRPDWKEPGP